jgi:hypothetical protein
MRSLTKVAIRIILIFLFLNMIVALFNHGSSIWIFLPRITGEDIYPQIFILAGAGLIGTLILGILWWKTDWLVKVIAGNIPDDSLVVSTSNLDLFKVALRIIGIFLVVTTIPQLIGLIGYRLSFPSEPFEAWGSQQQAVWIKELLIIIIVTLILGFLLTLIGGKLATYIRSLWTTAIFPDTKKDSAEKSESDS